MEQRAIYLGIIFLESRVDVGLLRWLKAGLEQRSLGLVDTQHTASTSSYIMHVRFAGNPPGGGHCRLISGVSRPGNRK